ncbi:extracellular solute-binding protein [Glycomyces sp. TRM65418]|uniref:ABC transporter substrate-binding protein n=1 Tax=Glycomyces sp. TRM65418 TaxID=2867006 RepID=UPI001CE53324|nr:extracellular solute-binding protein [Glycomyces sp. TRM65418]MCC3763197.1 extracellular solute-binding protein [Glycomyces sp. TRM65418]QZD57201.1 extracellular solute-binding protein [Glycomyces sp. TRM65418]
MMRNDYRLRRRSLLTGASAAAVAAAAAACGDDGPAGTADDPVQISFEWWGDDTRAELTQQAVDLFQEKNEGIKVQTNFADFPTFWEGLTGRMASRDLPDVFQMDYSRLRQFGSNGMLLPLEGVVDTEDFREGFLETAKLDGQLVAVPIAGNTLGLIYRADWFEAHGAATPVAGYTWDDYKTAISTLTPALGEGKWGGGDWCAQYHFMELWLRQQGGSFYTEDGSALNFEPAQLAEWWTTSADLYQAGMVPPVETTIEWTEGGLVQDVLASEIGWDNFMAGYAPTVEANGGTLALAAPPTVDPSNLGLYLKPSMQLVISATTEHAEASAKLIDFLLGDPEAIAILGTNRGVPATNTGLENVELDANTQAVLDYEASVSEYLTSPPPAPPAATGAIEAKFMEIYQQVQYGEMTAQEAADLFFTEAETLLAAEQ